MKIPFLDLADTNSRYAARLKQAAGEVIDSGIYLHGRQTAALESELAAICGTSYAVTTGNGLDALRLVLRGYMELGRLSPGDEVLLPAHTFIATFLPVTELGLKPVPVEPSVLTYNIDFNDARKKLTPATKAVILVHLYGTPCWDAGFAMEMRRRGILVIEDNAQALGARAAEAGFGGTCATGGLGDAAIVSFYPTKNIGGLGDGGAVTTSDAELAGKVRVLGNYGSDRRYHNIFCGYNTRMDELQAAFLRVKLADVANIISERNAVAAAYSDAITNPAVMTPLFEEGTRQMWHQYVVRTPARDALMAHLESRGIGSGIHYAVPPHLQPCYEGVFDKDVCPVAANLCSEILSLPIANISPVDARYIAGVINEFNV